MESVEMPGMGEDIASTRNRDFATKVDFASKEVGPKEDFTTAGKKVELKKPFSAFELLNHREVLRQGINYLNKLGSLPLIPVEVNNELGIQEENQRSETIDDSLLMPPPKQKLKPKRQFTLEVDSLAFKIGKMKKHKKRKRSAKKDAERSARITKRKRETVDSASTEGVLVPNSVVPEMEGPMPVAPNFVPMKTTSDTHAPDGLEMFLELMGRCTDEQTPKLPNNDENNVEQTTDNCGILKNLVTGYEEKRKQYNKNARTVENLTWYEFMQHFSAIREELKDIFDGIQTSVRHGLYLEGFDLSSRYYLGLKKENELKSLSLSIPFTGDHSFMLVSAINKYLLEEKEYLEYSKYIAYVMIPEAFIRIYARISGLSYKSAELEMMFGALNEDNQSH